MTGLRRQVGRAFRIAEQDAPGAAEEDSISHRQALQLYRHPEQRNHDQSLFRLDRDSGLFAGDEAEPDRPLSDGDREWISAD